MKSLLAIVVLAVVVAGVTTTAYADSGGADVIKDAQNIEMTAPTLNLDVDVTLDLDVLRAQMSEAHVVTTQAFETAEACGTCHVVTTLLHARCSGDPPLPEEVARFDRYDKPVRARVRFADVRLVLFLPNKRAVMQGTFG